VKKTVTTGLTPPKPDIYMLADTTGSMVSIINSVKSNMMLIQSSVKGMEPTAEFGVGQYKDFPFDAFAFQHEQAITANDVDVDAAAAVLFASGGSDGSEGQFFALDEIANNPGTIGWRLDSTRIVVWFGDAPGHDPVCAAISGLGFDIDEARVIADLQAAGITVIAISTVTGFPNGLNHDPAPFSSNYPGTCAIIDGVLDQANRITVATGGSHTSGINAATITQAIIDAIEDITIDVVPDASDCTNKGLEVTFTPPTHEDVPPDTSVMFDEKITVPEDTEVEIIHCEILFRAGDGGILGAEKVWITIPQITIPQTASPPIFLVIDEDSIDNGNPPNFFDGDDVNEDDADVGVRTQLPFFAANIGETITLHTGEVGDEGWFAPKFIPPTWDAAGPTADGISNYLMAGPGLGSGDDPEALLDKIPDVTPLRASGLKLLEGEKVCAVVYDSDVSMNYDPLNGSLKGANLGTVAFEVLSVTPLTDASSSSLPEVEIRILDASNECNDTLELLTEASEPISSSEPFDVIP